MRRICLATILLASLAALAIAALRWDAALRDPTTIFWWLGLPLAGAVLAAAFLVLSVLGRFALALILLGVGALEAGAWVLNASSQAATETWIDPEYYQAHPVLGWAPKPGITTRTWKRVAGEPVYDVRYSIDALGRRVTPGANGGARNDFLLLFGCSVTFGEGVNDAETLPHFIAQQAPGTRPYNYAFHGYGPQQMLARLETQDLRAEVAEPEGDLVYLFIDAHVNRAIGSMVVYTGWADKAPYYDVGLDGTPFRDGTLTTGRPATSILYSILGQSQLLRRVQQDVPLTIGEDHIDLTARILAASKQRFHDQFGGGRFVVVIFPGSRHAVAMRGALARHRVEFLDYSALFDHADPQYAIANDWHPTALAHRRLAEQLVRDLDLEGS